MTFTGRRFFLSWILLVHAQANNIVQQHAFRDPDADDMLFTQSVIFDAQVANRIGCGVVCANSPDCVTFTFTPVTSTFGKCRGYSEGMTSASVNSSMVGTKSYFFRENADWLEKTCVIDSDCAALHSGCFEGQCLCTPGYYYSYKRNFCIDTCPFLSLGSTYLKYPGSVIWGFDMEYYSDYTDEQCADACLAHPLCRDFDIHTSAGDCYLHSVTPLDGVPFLESTDYDYSQRTCE